MTRAKMNAVTWAALDVYAGTVEGQAVPGLGELLRDEAPRLNRLKNAARSTAEGLGVLTPDGQLTAQGLAAVRAHVERLGLDWGSAGGAR